MKPLANFGLRMVHETLYLPIPRRPAKQGVRQLRPGDQWGEGGSKRGKTKAQNGKKSKKSQFAHALLGLKARSSVEELRHSGGAPGALKRSRQTTIGGAITEE